MNYLQCRGLTVTVLRGGAGRGGARLLLCGSFLSVLFGPEVTKAGDLPACLPPVEIARTQAARVEDHGVLALRDGRSIKLEGLLWPAGERDGAPAAIRRQAMAGLKQLVVGGDLAARTRAPKLDRYDRLRAQGVLADGTWIQRAILLQGLARVSLAPDRSECAREFYAAEAEARAAHRGLWASTAYAIRTPDSLRWRDLGTFQIVEGAVRSAAVRGSRAYLNFGRNWRTDFTVTISPNDMKAFRAAGIDPYSYANKTVRVRGWVDRLNGYEIEIAVPEDIELVLAPNSAPPRNEHVVRRVPYLRPAHRAQSRHAAMGGRTVRADRSRRDPCIHVASVARDPVCPDRQVSARLGGERPRPVVPHLQAVSAAAVAAPQIP
jgi:micrococcal nuclease